MDTKRTNNYRITSIKHIMNKTALILGGGGFIGGHLGKKLKKEGYWVRAVDIKHHEYFDWSEICDEFICGRFTERKNSQGDYGAWSRTFF